MPGAASNWLLALAVIVLLNTFPAASLWAQNQTTLYSFTGGSDGGYPEAGLIRDGKGNFYGTTTSGGAYGYGAVFELSSTGTYSVLYSFQGSPDGAHPVGPLVRDSKGNLYGTAPQGGLAGACNSNCGVVFELVRTRKSYTEKILYSFTDGTDGSNPYGGLVRDKEGNLYGVAYAGGTFLGGTAFEITSTGTMKTLYQFAGSDYGDGAGPYGALYRDAKGNLYGTTEWGGTGCSYPGCGTAFELTSAGTEIVLHSFTGTDGGNPFGSLMRDKKGNIYGTTTWGGSVNAGTVFELTKKGSFLLLHSFTDAYGVDGAHPTGGLVIDKQGNLYGTTVGGGYNYGTIFEVTATGEESILYSFIARADGSSPYGNLVLGSDGSLYGTAYYGGEGDGVIFKIVP